MTFVTDNLGQTDDFDDFEDFYEFDEWCGWRWNLIAVNSDISEDSDVSDDSDNPYDWWLKLEKTSFKDIFKHQASNALIEDKCGQKKDNIVNP